MAESKRVIAGTHTRNVSKSKSSKESKLHPKLESDIRNKKPVWSKVQPRAAFTYNRDDFIGKNAEKNTFKQYYGKLFEDSPISVEFDFGDGTYIVYKKSDLPEWLKKEIVNHADHYCKFGVNKGYIEKAIDQCHFILVHFASQNVTATVKKEVSMAARTARTMRTRSMAKENVVVPDQKVVKENVVKISKDNPVVLGFALMKKMTIKSLQTQWVKKNVRTNSMSPMNVNSMKSADSRFSNSYSNSNSLKSARSILSPDEFDTRQDVVDYGMSRDEFMTTVVNKNLHPMILTDTFIPPPYPNARLSTVDKERFAPLLSPKLKKVERFLYVDVICSRYKQGIGLMNALENPEFRNVMRRYYPYQALSLRGIPSAYSLYVGLGYIKTIDFETIYPIYFQYNNGAIYTMDRESAKAAHALVKNKSLVIAKVYNDDRYGRSDGFFLSKILPPL